MELAYTIPAPADLTDEELSYVAARMREALNQVDLPAIARQIAEDLFLHGEHSIRAPVGILA